MIAEAHLTTLLEPLEPSDTVKYAYEKLAALHVELLPVVKNYQLLNYIGYAQLEGRAQTDKLSDIPLYHPILPSILPEQHLFDALKQLKFLNLPMLAVQNEEGQYIGILKTSDIVSILSKSLSIGATGSIVVLEVLPQDYSLSDIARIIEYNDAKVLGVFTFEIEGKNELEVHLKLNTTMLKNILATLERYNYKVTQYFSREDLIDDLDSRYESLMKFLDI
jgi:signal-transduction protein with cAMP-binding, CBS, and nucleotidyltransferase domain